MTAGIPLANPDAKARRSRPYRLAGPSWIIPVLLFLGFFLLLRHWYGSDERRQLEFHITETSVVPIDTGNKEGQDQHTVN